MSSSSSTSALQSPAPALKKLREQLHDLEESLQPLISSGTLTQLTSSLEKNVETAAAADGKDNKNSSSSSSSNGIVLKGRLQSAQLQSSLAYVLLDLVWILVKVNGRSEPNQHPVAAELKRVQQYLQKVYRIDKGGGSIEDDQAPAIDAAKASRFIHGALGKRKIFAEDGSVQSVVDATGNRDLANTQDGGGGDNEGWTEQKNRKARRAHKQPTATADHGEQTKKHKKKAKKD